MQIISTIISFLACFSTTVLVSATTEPLYFSQMHKSEHAELLKRSVRSLRIDRSWTRSGYGVVFVYANNFNDAEITKIKTAIGEIRKHSCFPVTLLSQHNFWRGEYKKYPNYVFIEKNQAVGCGQAVVGMKGGSQLLTLSPDPHCLTVGTIMHEILHTLGIEHEQSRPDRNQYIEIHNPNVQNGLHNAFQIAHGSIPYGPYDYDSIMQYGRYAFAAHSNLPTLTSKIRGFSVPAFGNDRLSLWDKRKISAMTGCKTNF